MWYAHGDRAPSARATNDLHIYELALDTGITPDEIREMSIRDRNNMIMVNRARKLARRQVSSAQQIPASYVLDVNA